MASRASSSSGSSANGAPAKRVVKIASMTSTKSANHQETTTTTTFNANGSSSTSAQSPKPTAPSRQQQQPSPAPAASHRAGGSSSYVVRPGASPARPSVPPEGAAPPAESPSTSAGSTSASAAAAGPVKPVVVHVGKGKNSIIVNARQRGNPIMNHIKNVAWEYGDIVPDYAVGQHTCVLYLSLRYHRLHPEYLHQRIEKLAAMYQLRVLLVMCDVSDHQDPIREISKICIINNLTVMVCWTPEEAGLYLSTYKIYEHKPPDILKEKVHNDYRSYLNRSLTGIKGVNKTDVLTLSSSFGSFDRIIHASPEELSVCPGVGETKVRRLLEAFTGRFRGGGGSKVSVEGGVEVVAGKEMGNGKGKEVEREGTMEVDDGGDGAETAAGGAGEQTEPAREYSPDWPDEEEEADAAGEAEEPPRKKRLVTDSP